MTARSVGARKSSSIRIVTRKALYGLSAVALGATVLVGAQGLVARAEPPLTVEDAKAQMAQREAEAAALNQEYNDVKLQVDDAEEALEKKQKQLKDQRSKIEKLKKVVGQVALASLQNQSLGTTAQLFLHADTDQFLSQLSTVEKISQNQNNALQDYQEYQASLVTLEQSAADDLEALKSQQAQLKKIRKESEKKVDDAEKILDRLNSEQREAIAAEQAQLAKEAEQAAQQASDGGDGEAESTDSKNSDSGNSDSGNSDSGNSDSDNSDSDNSDSDENGSDSDNGSSDSGNDDGDEKSSSGGSGKGSTVLAWATKQKGKPYVFGADGPDAFDCSGLTLKAWDKVGVSLPHSSSKQFRMGTHVSKDDLRPGDLVFYYSSSSPSHVGIYAGNGQMIHAPNSSKPVQFASVDSMPYVGARRYG